MTYEFQRKKPLKAEIKTVITFLHQKIILDFHAFHFFSWISTLFLSFEMRLVISK